MLLPNHIYAPRTVAPGDGEQRYLVPWVADRVGGSDDYRLDCSDQGYAWGGVLSTPQEIHTLPDGGIGLFYPRLVDRLAGEQLLGPSALEQARADRGPRPPA